MLTEDNASTPALPKQWVQVTDCCLGGIRNNELRTSSWEGLKTWEIGLKYRRLLVFLAVFEQELGYNCEDEFYLSLFDHSVSIFPL